MTIKKNQIEDYISDSTQTELDGKLSLDGTDTMSGNLAMGGNNIVGGGDIAITGSYTGTDYNGVALTNGGSATNYLQEDGNYGPVSGGGAVDSVNGKTGVVTLNQDEIPDGTTYKQYSDTEKTKLAGIEVGAEVNDVDSVNGKTGVVALDKTDIGLTNVDNTSDTNKPVSTATQTALDGKVSTTGAETIAGLKTFTNGIEGDVNGVDIIDSGASTTYLSADGTYTTPAGGGGGGGLRETTQIAGTQIVNTILYEGAIGTASTLSAGYISLKTAPTGSSFVVSISKSTDDGATYGTAETVTLTATNKYVKGTISGVYAEGDWMKAEVTTIGSTVAGSDLLFTVTGS